MQHSEDSSARAAPVAEPTASPDRSAAGVCDLRSALVVTKRGSYSRSLLVPAESALRLKRACKRTGDVESVSH